MESADFANGANPPNLGDPPLTPLFQRLKPAEFRRYMLVLDSSGSMAGVSNGSLFCSVDSIRIVFGNEGLDNGALENEIGSLFKSLKVVTDLKLLKGKKIHQYCDSKIVFQCCQILAVLIIALKMFFNQ